jgi:glycosyltransferase involved in cell wall biosynthesis
VNFIFQALDFRAIALKSSPFVSLIIPVVNEAKRKRICLDSLENQTYPKNLHEVLVVDRGSDEAQDKDGKD